jgi:hypothetical protein
MITTTRLAGQLSVETYPDVLLKKASELHASGEYGIATVVSHMACEVAIERRLSNAVSAKLDAGASEALLAMFNGYGLNSDKQRSLYAALTGHLIQREPFWQDYKDSIRRRNAVVHGKQIATLTDAVKTLNVAKALVASVMT